MTVARVANLSARIATATLVLVAWLPFVRVGRQPYRPGQFASRIDELRDLTVIDGSWARPAQLALGVAVLGALAAASWGRWQRPFTLATAATGLVAAVLGYRMVAESSLVSAGPGLAVLLAASVSAVVASAMAWIQRRPPAADA